MNIHEYQAKQLLKECGIKVSDGVVIHSDQMDTLGSILEQIDYAVFVVKAQIHSGGRGKAGGIKVCKTRQEAMKACWELMDSKIVTKQNGPHGQTVREVYIEEGTEIEREMYLSMLLDNTKGQIIILTSAAGGVDVEGESHINSISVSLSCGVRAHHVLWCLNSLKLSKVHFDQLQNLLVKFYDLLLRYDLTQIEINPLVLDKNDQIKILDAKMNFDDNALYRQPIVKAMEDIREMTDADKEAHGVLSYVQLDGDIACIVNGAGLAMATMDIIKFFGGAPANFLDIGGNADKETIHRACKIIAKTNPSKILINIFGGIVRCDMVAESFIDAFKVLGLNVPTVVRLRGTNATEAKTLLQASGCNFIYCDSFEEAARTAVG